MAYMVGDKVRISRGTEQHEGEVVMVTTDAVAVQTPAGLFTAQLKPGRSGWRLGELTAEEQVAAAAEQQRRADIVTIRDGLQRFGQLAAGQLSGLPGDQARRAAELVHELVEVLR